MKVLGTILNVLGSLILLFEVRNIGTGLFLTQMILGIGLIGFGLHHHLPCRDPRLSPPRPKARNLETSE